MNTWVDTDWLRPVRSARPMHPGHSERRDRLVCWPPAGGSAGFFQPFANALPDFDVWAVQPPGRGTRLRDHVVTDPEEAVGHVLLALDRLPPTDGRLAIMGHSLGTGMAHLLATRIDALVDLVVLSAWPVPDRHVTGALGKPAAELEPQDLFAFLRTVNTPGLGRLSEADVARYLLPPLKTDLELGDRLALLRDGARTTAPVLLTFADDDPVISPADAIAWHDAVDVRRQVRLLGGHFAVTAYVEDIAGAIKTVLPQRLPA